MYGYFKCSKCGKLWESAHAHPKVSGSTNVENFYAQDCKDCKIPCKPYRVEPTVCSICGQPSMVCKCDKHSDPKKPHRKDLCEKCRSGRLCQRL